MCRTSTEIQKEILLLWTIINSKESIRSDKKRHDYKDKFYKNLTTINPFTFGSVVEFNVENIRFHAEIF